MDRFPAINPGITFSDEDESYVKWMAEAGIVQGRGGGLFDPDAPVTRCEATAMLSRCAYPGLRLHLEG